MQRNISRTFYLIFSVLFLFVTLNNIAFSAHSEEVSVFPEAGHDPFLKVINSAQKTIHMSAYKFTDTRLIGALREAADRGVSVELLAEESKNIYKRPGISEEQQALEDPAQHLNHPKIIIHRTSERFNQSHYKMIAADESTAAISTGNFCPDTFDSTYKESYRDFALSTSNPIEIASILKVFLADITDRRVVPDKGNIIWGPTYQRSTFLEMCDGAQKSIWIYQQDMQDVGIAKALAGAARDGIDVRILMNPFPFGKASDPIENDPNIPNQTMMSKHGVKIMLCPKTYRVIHAKIIVVDGVSMYLGSGNLYQGSIDQTRELGIVTTNPNSIETVIKTFDQDWAQGSLFVAH